MDFASATVSVPGDPTLLDLTRPLAGIEPGDNSRDQELTQFLEMAGQAAERYIDNVIRARQVTERHARRSQPFALRYWPASGPLTVSVNGADLSDQFAVIYDEGIGWAVQPIAGYRSGPIIEQVEIRYTAGFDPLPADLAYALAQSGASYETGGAGGAVKREMVVGVGSIEYDTDDRNGSAVRVGQIPAAAVAVLDRYRREFA